MAAAAVAPLTPEGLRGRFDQALQLLSYSERCRTLGALGKELRAAALPAERLSELLDGLSGDPTAAGNGNSAFVEKARLIVASAAGSTGYARKFLDHQSQTVRYTAVHSKGILSPADAKAAFLDVESSRKLKLFLTRCPALPCDREVLEQAWLLFGEKDKEKFWDLLVRVSDEELLKQWLAEDSEMNEWLAEKKTSTAPNLAQLARRFPNTLVGLVKANTIRWQWYWAKEILAVDPALVLRAAFSEGKIQGSGPKKGYVPTADRQKFGETLAAWAWRRHPKLILEIIGEVVRSDLRNKYSRIDPVLVSLMSSTSTRHALTARQKISHLMSVWSCLPDADKDDTSRALAFLEHLPRNFKEERASELQDLVDAAWNITDSVGRETRRLLLVGPEDKDVCTKFMRAFFCRLPPRLAVDQFFRILKEFEAASTAYNFMISEICKTANGKHDALMQRVFERYLQKEGMEPVEAATMFQVVLTSAMSRDVIQATFNLLLQQMGSVTLLSLLVKVVVRMGTLERRSREIKDPEQMPPLVTLPLPVEWVRLVSLKKNAEPHADFLLRVLHSGTGGGDLLGAMLNLYGHCFFWNSLLHVLEHVTQPKTDPLMKVWQFPAAGLKALAGVDVVALSAPLPQSVRGDGAAPAAAGAATFSQYFEKVGDAKKKVNAKDPSVREEGYDELLTLARRDQDPAKAFADLFPFYVQRFAAEPEAVRLTMLRCLIDKKALPEHLWGPSLPHFRSLWRTCSKARESSSYACSWRSLGVQFVQGALDCWDAAAGPSDVCLFGLEVAGTVDLPGMVVKAATRTVTDNEVRLQGEALASAAKWVLETTVPLASETGISFSSFWDALKTLAKALAPTVTRPSERTIWDLWPFVQQWWRALLSQGIKQKSAEYVLIDFVEFMVNQQGTFKVSTPKQLKEPEPWWEPLECDEYKAAVDSVIKEIESGEIPAKEGSLLLARRVGSLVKRARAELGATQKGNAISRCSHWMVWPRKRRPRVEERFSAATLPALVWVQKEAWDIPQHHVYQPLPWQTYRCRDAVAAAEVRTLSKLLSSGNATRQVLWQILDVAAMLSGPEISDLIGEAIAILDPQLEGKARCVARHYPYLNSALTRGESQRSSPDVLTPLMELWLLEDATRDARVAKLMERHDCQYFLFFGTSFARHVSNLRQEWLHQCLLKLCAPGEGDIDFYHYPRRGPVLRQLAQLGPGCQGWRNMLKKQDGMDPAKHTPLSVQMYLWHEETQAAFMKTALGISTEAVFLSLIPRVEFANGIAMVSKLLDQYPREQTTKPVGEDLWGWDVIQAAGAYSDAASEVNRRFLSLPAPWYPDAVDDPEVEILLTALGRADDASKALKVLGQYAGKVKQAKEAVTKMISQVSPPRARQLIRDVMLPKKAGVGLQVAGLKKIVELHIPQPLELYRMAWRKGSCQRDVAGNILGKVATSTEFEEEEVRGFFNFFDRTDRQEDQVYVADFLLDQLVASPDWTLSFMPEVVGKLALLPGMTTKAVSALTTTRTNPTGVLVALTKVFQTARLAQRVPKVCSSNIKDLPETQLLKDLTQQATCAKARSLMSELARRKLDDSDPATLDGFVQEAMLMWEEAVLTKEKDDAWSMLDSTLTVWVRLLRPSEFSAWPGIIKSMEDRVASCGDSAGLLAIAKAVASHIWTLGLGGQDRDEALAAVGAFIQRVLDVHLADKHLLKPGQREDADGDFTKMLKRQSGHKKEIVVVHWARLLSIGCVEAETDALFAHCPEGSRLDLAKSLVNGCVEQEAKRRRAADKDRAVGEAEVYQTKRPTEGWQRTTGVQVKDVKVGSEVSGVVTNSSGICGVFVNFGCIKDGKLDVPDGDWKKYRSGDVVERMIVNNVRVSKSGQPFIGLLLMPSAGSGGDPIPTACAASAKDVARRALGWLASPPGPRDVRMATLAELWASVVALEQDGSMFEADLELLGKPAPTPRDLVRLVEKLLGLSPAKSLAREALHYLGGSCPEEAIRLWPALLTPNSGVERVEVEDVQALLRLCDVAGHRLPEIRGIVARGLSDDVIEALVASALPEARLVVVQSLQERTTSGEPPAKLRELCSDPCHVVSMAARQAWVVLGGVLDEAKEEAEDEDDPEGVDDAAAAT